MSTQTLLIVDDSRLSRMMIKNFANEIQPDWNIIEAKDGDDALKVIEGESIDWMTVDYNMPGMDGITLIGHLRKGFPEAKIALLTANIQDSIKKRSSELGVEFIQKPITQDKIFNYIKS